MWLVGVGIATAVSVAPNAALRGFDHIAGTATAVYFCLGGLLLGIIGTLIITLLSTAYHLADHRLSPHPRNSSALSVLHQSQQTPSQPRRT